MRTQQMYGLFEKVGPGVWKRLYPTLAYPKSQAVRIFQDALLGGDGLGVPNERRLRVVPNPADWTERRFTVQIIP